MKNDRTKRRGAESGDSGISRRRFIEAAGASGVAAGLTGYVGEDGEVAGRVQSQGTTVQWASDQLAKDNADAIKSALHDAGLSKDIQLEILAGSWGGGRQSQYQQWLSAGRNKPDLFMMDTGWTIPFIVREQIANVGERLPQEAIDKINNDYFDASVASAKDPNGNLYGMPLFVDLPTMQYNKDFVKKAGYGESEFKKWATESMKWKQFSNVTKEALDANDDVDYGFTFQAKAYEGLACCDFNEFMSSWGGAYFGNPEKNLFGPVGERPVTVGEEQVLNSVRMIRTFIHGSEANGTLDGYEGNISPPAVLQWDEEPSRKPFTTGNAVMHRNWPYSINTSGSEDNLGKSLGVMPIPYAKTEDEAKYPMTGGPVAALGGWHMTLNPNSQNKEASMEVMKAMMEKSFRLALFEIVGWIPPEPGLLETKRAQNVPIMGRYLEQLKVAGENAIPRPVTAIWPQESQRIAQQVNQAYTKGSDPKKMMSTLQQQLKQLEQQGGG